MCISTAHFVLKKIASTQSLSQTLRAMSNWPGPNLRSAGNVKHLQPPYYVGLSIVPSSPLMVYISSWLSSAPFNDCRLSTILSQLDDLGIIACTVSKFLPQI